MLFADCHTLWQSQGLHCSCARPCLCCSVTEPVLVGMHQVMQADMHPRETYITANTGEGPNDRNDRAIRVAAAWYAARLPSVRVLVLTNDADNRRRALEAGLQAMTVQARP